MKAINLFFPLGAFALLSSCSSSVNEVYDVETVNTNVVEVHNKTLNDLRSYNTINWRRIFSFMGIRYR